MSWFDTEASLPVCYAPVNPVYSREQCIQKAKRFLDELLASKGRKFVTKVTCACCQDDFSYLPTDVKRIMDTGFCGHCFCVKNIFFSHR